MDNSTSISLVDNTVPSQQQISGDSPRQPSAGHQRNLSKHLSRASVHEQLAKRKYAKWQPERLGVSTNADTDTDLSREPTHTLSERISNGGPSSSQDNGSTVQDVDSADLVPSRVPSQVETVQSSRLGQPITTSDTSASKPKSELDILYENQRGSFFFGIPLYSHGSLLNFDPSAWMTQDRRPSAVNITNAQLPDPSWEWAWRTWYVDMSGDVDEQGWQYAFSFSSSQWHGTHPWFHSFVRRRRWVRLRAKVLDKRQRVRSEFERAHMLNEDYFTIHSSRARSREQSLGLSRVESGFLSRVSTKVDETELEEIRDIPSLMHALKLASIDREKICALKQFVQEGGEEIYYLHDKIPEIMSMFLFQASRWQFVTYLLSVAQHLSQSDSTMDEKDTEKAQRKKDNLIRAAESAKTHITGPDVFTDIHGEAPTELLDLTPVSRHDILLSKRDKATDESLHVRRKEIKGIPKAAEIGLEGHIY